MNYLRGALSAVSAASQYYKDLPPINPSTLTGAIDVIVIQHPGKNGEPELACSPFHVRFGKWQVLRPGEKKVNVMVNGRPIPFNMKIGEAGEAFFVFETHEDVPEELITSPLLEPTKPEEAPQPDEGGKFGSKNDTGKVGEETAEEAIQRSTEETLSKVSAKGAPKPAPEPDFLDLDADPSPESLPPPVNLTSAEPPVRVPSASAVGPSSFLGHATDLGQAVARLAREEQKEKLEHFRDAIVNLAPKRGPNGQQHKVTDEGKGDEALPQINEKDGQPPEVRYTDDVVFDMAGYHSKEESDQTVVADESQDRIGNAKVNGAANGDRTPSTATTSSLSRHPSREHIGEASITVQTTPPSPPPSAPLRAKSEPPDLGPGTSPPQYSWEWGAFPTRSPARQTFKLDAEKSASVPSLVGRDGGKDKDKTKTRVPFGEGGRLSKDPFDDGKFWLNMEGKNIPFELSTCGHLERKDEVEDAEKFVKKRVTYKQFMENASIVHDDDLVIRWDEKYILRSDSSPLLPALVVWRDGAMARPALPLDEEPLSSSDEREHEKRPLVTPQPTRVTSTWARWWGRSKSDDGVPPVETTTTNEADRPTSQPTLPDPSEAENQPGKPADVQRPPSSAPSEPPESPPSGPRRTFAKTLRLTSDQLKALDLKPGANSITFSLTTTGTIACTARIFVWDSTDQIVISDIDGTITKSDALGHVFTMIGRDWTHLGVAKLYTDICRNGYKIMYLTSRAIGQADSTRDYLKGINQDNYQLPEGPVIMSPDRLMASLHREVIMRKPEVFKMACLRDIQRLFGNTSGNPFYAGFGNRITDALSYRSVNVPSKRIFTIDSTGEVKMELLELAGYKSSYIHMTDLVDQMFPPIHRKWAPEYTDFNFWRAPVAEFELPDLSPPSPALSATSATSNQSRLSRLRNFSLRRQPSNRTLSPAPSDKASPKLPSTVNGGHSRHTSAGSRFSFFTSASDEQEELKEMSKEEKRARRRALSIDSMPGSLPGSPGSQWGLDDPEFGQDDSDEEEGEEEGDDDEYGDEEEEEEDAEQFDDDLLATGEMENVPLDF